MNDDLQKALAEILNKTTQGAEAGVGFLQRELPDVVQQLLVWHGVKSAVFFVILLSLSLISAWATKRVWTWAREEDEGDEAATLFPAGAAVVLCVSAFGNLDWLQILLAPKLYLIEYAASLVK